MKRILVILLLCLAGNACPAQVFIDNPEYIYGVGIAKDESAADTVALASLARAIQVKVINESTYEVSENSRGISRTSRRRTTLTTNLKIEGAQKYVEPARGGKVKVYYYINKFDYVNERIARYERYMHEADTFETSKEPHAINYYLGAIYQAYLEVDDELLNALYGVSRTYRTYAMTRIESAYRHCGYILSVRDNGERQMMVRDENSRPLPDFEYLSTSGRWTSPRFFLDDIQRPCDDPQKVMWALIEDMPKVKTPGTRMYRIPYEIKTPNGAVKIDVPESFYFERYFIL